MADLIERQAAIDAIFSEPLYESGMKKRDADAAVPAIYEKIKSLPSAQPWQRIGTWIIGGHHIRCSVCDVYMCSTDREGDKIPTTFCPNCGAKMEEQDD